MRIKALLAVAATALFANPAQAVMVAGWDFSQYFADGTLITNGTTFAFENTLDANYSDLEAVSIPGIGPDSGAFGTLFFDGTAGSTNIDPAAFPLTFAPSQFAPAGSSLSSNVGAPGLGNDFNILATQIAEGQDFANSLAMTATAAVSVVFQASVIGGSNWGLTFGAQTLSGSTDLVVEISGDGTNYAAATESPLNITALDTLQQVSLAALGAVNDAFVRLTFSGDQTFIDNVAITADIGSVPEPTSLALVLTGIVGLGLYGRRR